MTAERRSRRCGWGVVGTDGDGEDMVRDREAPGSNPGPPTTVLYSRGRPLRPCRLGSEARLKAFSRELGSAAAAT
jgi:hypothetical protein